MSTRRLPMFPLGTVLFPYGLLPLHVFEARYRIMVRHLLRGDGEFGVVLIERGSEVGGGDQRVSIGTVARIAQANPLPDGRYTLTAVGIRRLSVQRWLPDDPYPLAEVVELEEPPAPAGAGALRERVDAALRRVLALQARAEGRPPRELVLHEDPVRAAFEAAGLAPLGPYDAQRVLAAADTAHRLELLAGLLEERGDALDAPP